MHSPEVNLNAKVVTFCRFEGSRSKSPEDSMEVEGIDDWKISRRKIARKYPWQAGSSEVDSQMWTQSCLCIYCLAWGQKLLPSVTHRPHKQYNFVQWRPKSKTKCRQFSRYLESSHGKEKYLKPRVSVSESQSNYPPWQCCSHRWRPLSSRAPL